MTARKIGINAHKYLFSQSLSCFHVLGLGCSCLCCKYGTGANGAGQGDRSQVKTHKGSCRCEDASGVRRYPHPEGAITRNGRYLPNEITTASWYRNPTCVCYWQPTGVHSCHSPKTWLSHQPLVKLWLGALHPRPGSERRLPIRSSHRC